MKLTLAVLLSLVIWGGAIVLACDPSPPCIETGPYCGMLQLEPGGIYSNGVLSASSAMLYKGWPVPIPLLTCVPTFTNGFDVTSTAYVCSQNQWKNRNETNKINYFSGPLFFEPPIPINFNQVTNQTFVAKVVGRPTSLMGWWSAEDLSDQIGTNCCTPVGDIYFVNGQVGQSFFIGGFQDGLQLPVASDLQAQSFTIEGWIQRADINNATFDTNGFGYIFAYGTGGYGLALCNDGRLMLCKVGDSYITTVSPAVTNADWHHIAVTKSCGIATFYVDGISISSVGFDPGFVFTNTPAIGSEGGGTLSSSFWGSIDELALYNTALSPAQIQKIYTDGVQGIGKRFDSLPLNPYGSYITNVVGTYSVQVLPDVELITDASNDPSPGSGSGGGSATEIQPGAGYSATLTPPGDTVDMYSIPTRLQDFTVFEISGVTAPISVVVYGPDGGVEVTNVVTPGQVVTLIGYNPSGGSLYICFSSIDANSTPYVFSTRSARIEEMDASWITVFNRRLYDPPNLNIAATNDLVTVPPYDYFNDFYYYSDPSSGGSGQWELEPDVREIDNSGGPGSSSVDGDPTPLDRYFDWLDAAPSDWNYNFDGPFHSGYYLNHWEGDTVSGGSSWDGGEGGSNVSVDGSRTSANASMSGNLNGTEGSLTVSLSCDTDGITVNAKVKAGEHINFTLSLKSPHIEKVWEVGFKGRELPLGTIVGIPITLQIKGNISAGFDGSGHITTCRNLPSLDFYASANAALSFTADLKAGLDSAKCRFALATGIEFSADVLSAKFSYGAEDSPCTRYIHEDGGAGASLELGALDGKIVWYLKFKTPEFINKIFMDPVNTKLKYVIWDPDPFWSTNINLITSGTDNYNGGPSGN